MDWSKRIAGTHNLDFSQLIILCSRLQKAPRTEHYFPITKEYIAIQEIQDSAGFTFSHDSLLCHWQCHQYGPQILPWYGTRLLFQKLSQWEAQILVEVVKTLSGFDEVFRQACDVLGNIGSAPITKKPGHVILQILCIQSFRFNLKPPWQCLHYVEPRCGVKNADNCYWDNNQKNQRARHSCWLRKAITCNGQQAENQKNQQKSALYLCHCLCENQHTKSSTFWRQAVPTTQILLKRPDQRCLSQ